MKRKYDNEFAPIYKKLSDSFSNYVMDNMKIENITREIIMEYSKIFLEKHFTNKTKLCDECFIEEVSILLGKCESDIYNLYAKIKRNVENVEKRGFKRKEKIIEDDRLEKLENKIDDILDKVSMLLSKQPRGWETNYE